MLLDLGFILQCSHLHILKVVNNIFLTRKVAFYISTCENECTETWHIRKLEGSEFSRRMRQEGTHGSSWRKLMK